MKTGNAILAVFLWLCIPATFWYGAFFSVIGGFMDDGVCVIIGPILFFILGLIALITGMEPKKTVPRNHLNNKKQKSSVKRKQPKSKIKKKSQSKKK